MKTGIFLLLLSVSICGCMQVKMVSEQLMINNLQVLKSKLVMKETYIEGEYMLPEGEYFPDMVQFNDGVRYRAPGLIHVGYLLFSGYTKCYGGIVIYPAHPEKGYEMFAENCQGEQGFVASMKNKAVFEIQENTN